MTLGSQVGAADTVTNHTQPQIPKGQEPRVKSQLNPTEGSPEAGLWGVRAGLRASGWGSHRQEAGAGVAQCIAGATLAGYAAASCPVLVYLGPLPTVTGFPACSKAPFMSHLSS